MDDTDFAKLCLATYNSPPSLSVPASGAYVCITQFPGRIVFAFRGSISAEDWVRDFLFLPIQAREHPQLGFCHAGFLDLAESIVGAVLTAAAPNDEIDITGHSLGGAEAVGVGALMVLAGRPPASIVTFGAPRFGMDKFVNVLLAVKVLPQYRRGNDIVPEVPRDVPPLWRFLDTRAPLIEVGKPQTDFLKCHNISGYVDDVTAYIAQQTAVHVMEPTG